MRLTATPRFLALGLVAAIGTVNCGDGGGAKRPDAGKTDEGGSDGGSAGRGGSAGGMGGTGGSGGGMVIGGAGGAAGRGGAGGGGAGGAAGRGGAGGGGAGGGGAGGGGMGGGGAGGMAGMMAAAVTAPWVGKDVGMVGMPTKVVLTTPANNNQSVLVGAFGAEIGGKADSFHFFGQPVKGNAHVLGMVGTIQMVDASTKAGVMIRDTLDPDSAMIFVGPVGDGMAGKVIYRKTKGGDAIVVPAADMNNMNIRTTSWIRLKREGTKVTIYVGGRAGVATADAVALGVVDITFANATGEAFYGVATCAHSTTMMTTAEYRGLQVDNLWAHPDTQALNQFELGTMGGGALYDPMTKKIRLTAWGQEWSSVAAYKEFMTLVGKSGAGEFSLRVRVENVNSSAPNSKAGIMYRAQVAAQGNADISSYSFSRSGGGVSLTVTPGAGVLLEGRLMGYEDQKWEAKAMTVATLKAPIWLRLDKVIVPIPNDPLGASVVAVAAYYSTPNAAGAPTNWVAVGSPLQLGSVGASTIGLCGATYNTEQLLNATLGDLTWGTPMPVSLTDGGAPDAAAPDAATMDLPAVVDAADDSAVDATTG